MPHRLNLWGISLLGMGHVQKCPTSLGVGASRNTTHSDLIDFAPQRIKVAPNILTVSARVFIRADRRQTVISAC